MIFATGDFGLSAAHPRKQKFMIIFCSLENTFEPNIVNVLTAK
jgi:hypothetical protein